MTKKLSKQQKDMQALDKAKRDKAPAREQFYKQVGEEIAANKAEIKKQTEAYRKDKSTAKGRGIEPI